MDRVAIEIGNIKIYWYAIMIFIGMIVAIIVARNESKRQNINMEFFTNLIFYIILFGILGARLYYVLFNLDYYLNYPIEIVQIWNGGLAIHGGLIAGVIVTIFYTKKYKVNTFKMLDICLVGVIIAQAIGRWGNFFNQEAYGRIVSRVTLESYKIPKFIIDNMYILGEYREPTFLYESIWTILGFIVLLIIRRRKYTKIGELTGIYLVWYSLGRFFIESLRSDSLMLGTFKFAQIISIILFITGIIIIVVKKRGSKLDNRYNQGEKDEIRF